MKVLVCGGRNYRDRNAALAALDDMHRQTPFMLVIHGGASGADYLADRWAWTRRVEAMAFNADWNVHGAVAGLVARSPIRRAAGGKWRPGTAAPCRRATSGGVVPWRSTPTATFHRTPAASKAPPPDSVPPTAFSPPTGDRSASRTSRSERRRRACRGTW
ncbi:DUF2493 domain-containing protein [Ancylobacter mangrovi]|uniref:DUF2493 domain-containing protein n=1 Tax=Ancylobacter mangrovi TaxID=2972472 RepID=UPI0035A8DE50